MSPRFLTLFAILVVVPSSGRAAGFVERLEPPVLERGKTTRVVAVGRELGKALDLWTTLSKGTIQATPMASTATGATFDVRVATDAPVGICGVRLATIDGLSNAVPFLIDDLPVHTVSAADMAAGKVSLPVSLWGPCREAGVDRFAIEVRAGQRVSFEAVGNRLGKDVDPLVAIRDAKGRLLVERDNDPGLYFDCRFVHTFATSGIHTVEIRDARYHGTKHGQYVLRMGRFPAARVGLPTSVPSGARAKVFLSGDDEFAEIEVPALPARGLFFGVVRRPGDEGSTWLPLEAGDGEVTVHRGGGESLRESPPALIPGLLCGVLSQPGQRHLFRVELAKGQRIQVRGEARVFNSPADLELAITDAAGKELRRAIENNKEEIVLDFAAGSAGSYGLRVRDLSREGGSAFAYRLEVRTGQPQISVSAEVEGLAVPAGTYQPIPLTVTRTDYAGPIALTLLGAPSGVTLTPAEIPAEVNTIVCRLDVAPGVVPGVHTLQVLARPSAPDAAPVLVRTQPLLDRQLVNVDLIPHALREDQRRLPPALTDRFAFQVTPASPFDFQMPEAQVVLARYRHAEFPIVTTRRAGFVGPITFRAKGGQIAPKEEGRTRVYAQFPAATPADSQVTGSIHSLILTNLAKHRVDVTATGMHEDRRVTLTRTFDLDVRTAFVVSAEPAKVSLEPGAMATVRLAVDRMKGFEEDVTVQLAPSPGLTYPERVVIPRGQPGVDLAIHASPERAAGRQNIALSVTGIVNGFEEEQRGARLEVEILKAKKK